jgi:hypothetical protein
VAAYRAARQRVDKPNPPLPKTWHSAAWAVVAAVAMRPPVVDLAFLKTPLSVAFWFFLQHGGDFHRT